jgi:hypothetical protein
MLFLTIRIRAWVCAKVRGLVHVIPETVDVDTSFRAKELGEFAVPVLLGIWVEPIREDGGTGPDCTFVERTVSPLLPYLELCALIVHIIVASPDGRIDHDNVVLLVLMEVVDQLADKLKRVALRIQGEEAAELHVVDIGPHGLLEVS